MKNTVEPASDLSLGTQRYMLQQQLRAQRQQIVEQFTSGGDDVSPHFPRSAIMRFIVGKGGNKYIIGLVLRKFGLRYPSALAKAYGLMRSVRK